MYKVITLSIFLILPAYGQGLSVSPIIKSAVLPGWGEKALDNKKRSRIFMSLELTLWTLCIGSYTYSNLEESMYKTFAAEHAGVSSDGKNHKFWVDIGNYTNLDQHNDEHLRWRLNDELYSKEFDWSWDSKRNMKKYENMRIRSDLMDKTGQYFIGGIVLNHIVSTINALYLHRLNEKNNIKVQYSSDKYGYKFNLILHL